MYFIGLSDSEKEGTFRWGTDFTEPEYTNWNSGQPSGGNLENCVLLVNEWASHLWDDFRCATDYAHDSNIHALCEKPLDELGEDRHNTYMTLNDNIIHINNIHNKSSTNKHNEINI